MGARDMKDLFRAQTTDEPMTAPPEERRNLHAPIDKPFLTGNRVLQKNTHDQLNTSQASVADDSSNMRQ